MDDEEIGSRGERVECRGLSVRDTDHTNGWGVWRKFGVVYSRGDGSVLIWRPKLCFSVSLEGFGCFFFFFSL